LQSAAGAAAQPAAREATDRSESKEEFAIDEHAKINWSFVFSFFVVGSRALASAVRAGGDARRC
jgi:hypothetical protein